MKQRTTLALVLLLGGCSQPPVEFTPADMTPTQDMSASADMQRDMPAPVDMAEPADMSGEDMAKVPCDGTCEGETPVCDETTNTCVGCTDESHCDGETPACDTDTNSCVGCIDESHCSGETPVCDVSKTTCVGCTENATCTDADASLCGAGQTCGACEMDADCAHLGLNRCVSGVCTACTTATEEQDCNGNACLPDGTCGTTPRETLAACQPCEADSECFADYRCIPMTFGDPAMPHGNFCLKVASSGCDRPYPILIDSPSVSGAASENYCGIYQVNTTCEAMLDFRIGDKACTMDADCGVQGLDDARCGLTGAGMVCTISCESNVQCFSFQTCDPVEKHCK